MALEKRKVKTRRPNNVSRAGEARPRWLRGLTTAVRPRRPALVRSSGGRRGPLHPFEDPEWRSPGRGSPSVSARLYLGAGGTAGVRCDVPPPRPAVATTDYSSLRWRAGGSEGASKLWASCSAILDQITAAINPRPCVCCPGLPPHDYLPLTRREG